MPTSAFLEADRAVLTWIKSAGWKTGLVPLPNGGTGWCAWCPAGHRLEAPTLAELARGTVIHVHGDGHEPA